MEDELESNERAGWHSSFPVFSAAAPAQIRDALRAFVQDASDAQVNAWREAVPALQREVQAIGDRGGDAPKFSAILEYKLPLEARRSDAIFLVGAPILVLELKGKGQPSQGDLDQAHGYARDLRAYHRDCQTRPVHAVLVPMRRTAPPELIDEVWVCGPQHLHKLVHQLMSDSPGPPANADAFLGPEAYRPLPTIVEAARELFFSRELRDVWHARAATTPAVDYITALAHEAARTKTRHLVLVTGVPGAGKTLVGMRLVHSHFLDDLAVPRFGTKPTVPALFLSGNGPLVEVLQYALKRAGGGGRTFVRHIMDYLDSYVPSPARIPPEHLLVFDEAQRAFTPDRVRALHAKWPTDRVQGEPRLFVDLCSRMPEWSVLVGLIGGGQEIHLGEEGGIAQWRDALLETDHSEDWTLHAPPQLVRALDHPRILIRVSATLSLDEELRFHGAKDLHEFVVNLLGAADRRGHRSAVAEGGSPARPWNLQGLRLYVTRDLELAKTYLLDRYGDQPAARFGLLASSRDRELVNFGVDNSWATTNRVKRGPWYVGGDDDPHSCRHLRTCMTEFGAQGLELDMALLAWGTDLVRAQGTWDNSRARKYMKGEVRLVDPFQLRVNAYRVLLTRGRDGTVVFIPPIDVLNETYEHLLRAGVRALPN